jgi:hypothetical protein
VILNVWMVSALFLAGVGALLALGAAAAALRFLAARPRDSRELAGERAHLLVLLVAVLALVRALAWPHFYLLLESCVAPLAPYGVMCTYGVTRVQPGLVLALQWLKPAVLFLLVAWWIVARVDARTEGAPFERARALVLVPLALLALAECALEAIYLFSDKLGHPVTCCTQPADLAGRQLPTARSPLALAGFDSPAGTLAVYAGATAAVVALALLQARAAVPARSPMARLALVALALANLAVTQWAWLDAVAPRVLGLPYHHCVYELLTRAPAMGVAALLTIAGNLAAAGAPLLAALRRRAAAAVDPAVRRLLRVAALALASALLVVAIHLV